MLMKTMLKIILVILGLSILSGFSAAQHFGIAEQERLGYALDRTDEIIKRAREVVQESGSERARLVLQTAIKLQESARNLSERAVDFTSEDMGMQSSRRTLDARGKAQRAIAITRQAGENEELVRRKLENTEEKMRRLEEQIGPNAPEQISLLFDSTRDKQRRAMELYRNRRLKPSLQMSMQIEKAIEDLARHINQRNRLENQYMSQAENYFRLRERINSSELSGNQEVQERLRAAEQMQERAESFYAGKNHRQAEKAMGEANEILRKLGEQLRDPARIKRALENIDELSARLRERVRQSDNGQIGNLYRNGQEHIDNARLSFQNGRFEAAASQLQAARIQLMQVSKLLGE